MYNKKLKKAAFILKISSLMIIPNTIITSLFGPPKIIHDYQSGQPVNVNTFSYLIDHSLVIITTSLIVSLFGVFLSTQLEKNKKWSIITFKLLSVFSLFFSFFNLYINRASFSISIFNFYMLVFQLLPAYFVYLLFSKDRNSDIN